MGVVQFTQDIFLINDSIELRVIDHELNLNPETLDTITVDVFQTLIVVEYKLSQLKPLNVLVILLQVLHCLQALLVEIVFIQFLVIVFLQNMMITLYQTLF